METPNRAPAPTRTTRHNARGIFVQMDGANLLNLDHEAMRLGVSRQALLNLILKRRYNARASKGRRQ